MSKSTPSQLWLGLERLSQNPELAASWGRVGLVCNQASVTASFEPTWKVVQRCIGDRLTTLFGPQHGFYGTAQDNMIETSHGRDPATGLPVYSLYSETREPTEPMLSAVDTLVIDLQITGCRIYTWKSTIAGCLRAARRFQKKVVVLDRPNPLGGTCVEGRVLDDDAHSFVGQFPIPMRHGLTAAEAARYFNSSIGAELDVVSMEGWTPSACWRDLGRPWVLTSPNLPTIDPVYVYPGTVIFEGTNVSEGRGTGLPFQFLGAPYVEDMHALKTRIEELAGDVSGVHLREAAFEPTSQKWAGKVCRGIQIHVTDPPAVRSYRLALAAIRAFFEAGGNSFRWKEPPYEYDYETLPIKLIIGSLKSDRVFEDPQNFSCDDPFWKEGISAYLKSIPPYLLYSRAMQDVT